jgi:hypothetical protein
LAASIDQKPPPQPKSKTTRGGRSNWCMVSPRQELTRNMCSQISLWAPNQ